MRSFKFFKFNPSGNTTVFLLGRVSPTTPHYCRVTLSPLGVGGEQAGMVEIGKTVRLMMAGGEFCVNACCALGGLLRLLSPPDSTAHFYTVYSSGLNEKIILFVRDNPPRWLSTAVFSMPEVKITGGKVEMPGIVHFFEEVQHFPDKEEAIRLAKNFLADKNQVYPAAGHVWWRKNGSNLEILPFVMVPEAGTAMLESACGSASLGLASLLGNSVSRVIQPSGKTLKVERRNDQFAVTGTVSLICVGEIWLPGRGCSPQQNPGQPERQGRKNN